VRKIPVLTPIEAAGLIRDEAVVSVSSSSGLGCPDAVLGGIGERFAQSGMPMGQAYGLVFFPSEWKLVR